MLSTACCEAHQFFLLGHRGARGSLLENCMNGFVYAQQLRPKLNGVEFDVQLTADHQLVIVHDEHLQRLGASQRRIYQTNLAELKTIFQSDWQQFFSSYTSAFLYQPILALTDLAPYLKAYEHIELEVKTHKATDYQALAQAVFEILTLATWNKLNITLTSFDTAFLAVWQHHYQTQLAVKTGLLLDSKTTLASEIAFFPMTASQVYDVCNLACRLGCAQIGIYFALITPQLVEIAHRFGLDVTAWTVNDTSIAQKLLDWGLTTIITDFPHDFCHRLK